MSSFAFIPVALLTSLLLVGCGTSPAASDAPTTDVIYAVDAAPDEAAAWHIYGPENAFRGSNFVALGALRGGESNVLVRGDIVEVCSKKGCWMKMVDGDAEIFVRFTDYGFFVPRNAAGHRAMLYGKATAQITPVDELRHYAEDAGASPEVIAAITEPKTEIMFMADGVRIAGDGLEAPYSAP